MASPIKILKQIDSLAGPVFLKIIPDQSPLVRPKKIKQILIIRPGGLGDALLLLPALKAASKKFQYLKIDILCERRNQQAFQAVSYINKILFYHNPFDLVWIFKKKYDLIIDTEQSHYLSAIVTRFLKADLKSGFKVNSRQKIYNLSIIYHHDIYEAQMFWNLIFHTLNFNESFAWDFPYFKQLKTNFLPEITGKSYICLFPGASIKERLWPEKYWAKIIDHMIQAGVDCILLGGQKETIQIKTIMKLCQTKKNIINMCNKLSILETTSVLKKASFLISTDSGILHLGVLSNIPTISLFGSGIAAKWAPQGRKHTIINKNLKCSPCTKFGTTPPCPNKNECMIKITPEDVIKSIKNSSNNIKTIEDCDVIINML